MHIRQHCIARPELGILPVYVVMPKEIRGFRDVYQAIMAGLDLDTFADLFSRAYRDVGSRKSLVSDVFPYIPDALNVLRKMKSESEATRSLASAWLMGTRGLTRGQLNTLEANRAIKTTDDCVAMLRGFIRLVQLTQTYRRVLIMLDECQRMWDFRPSIGANINVGLQTWYDSCASHLSLVLSFKCGCEEHVRRLLSRDLQSRADYQSISLPLLTATEAMDFIHYLLDHFRTSGSPSPWFPLSEEVVQVVVAQLTMHEGVAPRVLMKAFEVLLTEADFQLANNKQFHMETSQALDMVNAALRQLSDEG